MSRFSNTRFLGDRCLHWRCSVGVLSLRQCLPCLRDNLQSTVSTFSVSFPLTLMVEGHKRCPSLDGEVRSLTDLFSEIHGHVCLSEHTNNCLEFTERTQTTASPLCRCSTKDVGAVFVFHRSRKKLNCLPSIRSFNCTPHGSLPVRTVSTDVWNTENNVGLEHSIVSAKYACAWVGFSHCRYSTPKWLLPGPIIIQWRWLLGSRGFWFMITIRSMCYAPAFLSFGDMLKVTSPRFSDVILISLFASFST